jgi:hypothetical protein
MLDAGDGRRPVRSIGASGAADDRGQFVVRRDPGETGREVLP